LIFDCVPSIINKLKFHGAFGFTIRYNVRFKGGSCTVIFAKVVIHFLVPIGAIDFNTLKRLNNFRMKCIETIIKQKMKIVI
jgi:hypothetical protein